jgi:hypothetical protein|tara:strand:+ start:521 stop:766 length:246 start_codon:yes stop_codon:yes gene_type:complete
MSRLRANLITNQTADGAPTVQDGIVVTGICTATNFKKSDGSDVGAATVVTIGVRTGTAVTFSATGSSFNVVGRSGNIPISI